MEKKTVLVGLSGGVDSAAVAKLLLDEGYRVHGVYLSMCEHSDPTRARKVAEILGIPFTVAERRRRFAARVIVPFSEQYQRGETPNPCVECNRFLKIKSLIEVADRLGIDRVATGHYARIDRAPDGRYRLLQAKDQNKDQSYFLWKLTQKQLSRLLFPLADKEKEEIRTLAAHLVPQTQKESMEICFIPHKDTQRFLKERGVVGVAGDFVDREGKRLGQHQGIFRYTVGQRRGLGVSAAARLFVTEIRSEENCVVLGSKEDLMTDRIRVRELHFVSCLKRDLPKEGIAFRGRHRATPIPCRLEFEGNCLTLIPSVPVKRVAPGQSVCFYLGEVLLFGGVAEA